MWSEGHWMHNHRLGPRGSCNKEWTVSSLVLILCHSLLSSSSDPVSQFPKNAKQGEGKRRTRILIAPLDGLHNWQTGRQDNPWTDSHEFPHHRHQLRPRGNSRSNSSVSVVRGESPRVFLHLKRATLQSTCCNFFIHKPREEIS